MESPCIGRLSLVNRKGGVCHLGNGLFPEALQEIQMQISVAMPVPAEGGFCYVPVRGCIGVECR